MQNWFKVGAKGGADLVQEGGEGDGALRPKMAHNFVQGWCKRW